MQLEPVRQGRLTWPELRHVSVLYCMVLSTDPFSSLISTSLFLFPAVHRSSGNSIDPIHACRSF
jgi:hypothetical protein